MYITMNQRPSYVQINIIEIYSSNSSVKIIWIAINCPFGEERKKWNNEKNDLMKLGSLQELNI